MLKFIIIALVALGIWAYFTGFNFNSINVGDLQKNATQIGADAANNALNGVKNEKTIAYLENIDAGIGRIIELLEKIVEKQEAIEATEEKKKK